MWWVERSMATLRRRALFQTVQLPTMLVFRKSRVRMLISNGCSRRFRDETNRTQRIYHFGVGHHHGHFMGPFSPSLWPQAAPLLLFEQIAPGIRIRDPRREAEVER